MKRLLETVPKEIITTNFVGWARFLRMKLVYTKSDSQNLFIVLLCFLPHIPPLPHSPHSSTRKIRGVSKADLVLDNSLTCPPYRLEILFMVDSNKNKTKPICLIMSIVSKTCAEFVEVCSHSPVSNLFEMTI